MGRTREAGCVAAGVVIGAGACFCVHRLPWGRDDKENIWDSKDDEDEQSSDITEIAVETGREANTGMGARARLQGDSKGKTEVGVDSRVVRRERWTPTQGPREEVALFGTLKEQASTKMGEGARLGTVSGNRTLTRFTLPRRRGGGCHPPGVGLGLGASRWKVQVPAELRAPRLQLQHGLCEGASSTFPIKFMIF
uniref:Armadillo repeat containing X-linked 1 n=1 Tax=Molossus molossus TaxID=27622 RepID=A0A7J8HZK4_MOLMO|nr:armadillo repeat containing X-linked 1 [Molossus molossus]